MTPFGPMVGVAAIPPANFGGGSPIDLTLVLLSLACALAGVGVLTLLRGRRGRAAETRIAVDSKAASLAA
jgi:hypothetical protein